MGEKHLNVEHLKSGMMLTDWSGPARERQGAFQDLQQGPTGRWEAMVLANEVTDDPRETEGFGYPLVHRVDVFFWSASGAVHFESFYWTAGTTVRVLE